MVRAFAEYSDDPRVKVGAVIEKDGVFVSGGSNCLPGAMFPEDIPGWPENKHLFLHHAEEQAISSAMWAGKDLGGATLYVNAYPCDTCARLIVEAGIEKVVLVDELELKPEWKPRQDAAKLIFKLCGADVKKAPG